MRKDTQMSSNSPNPNGPIKKSVAETLNGFSVLAALGSGLLWHLSTVGAATPALAAITANENTGAAVLAIVSAGLAFAGLFKK
jgi:hypothetical protein